MDNQPNKIAAMPGEFADLPHSGPSRLLGLLRTLHIVGLSLATVLALFAAGWNWQLAVIPGLFAGIFLLGLLAVRVASKADEIRREETENRSASQESGVGIIGTVATWVAGAILLVGFIVGPLLVYLAVLELQEIFRTISEIH